MTNKSFFLINKNFINDFLLHKICSSCMSSPFLQFNYVSYLLICLFFITKKILKNITFNCFLFSGKDKDFRYKMYFRREKTRRRSANKFLHIFLYFPVYNSHKYKTLKKKNTTRKYY